MVELTLVRHGQASFDHDNYDQLSELGYQQGKWLGKHFLTRELTFDRCITGSQLRHQQTFDAIAAAMGQITQPVIHEGLNEYDFRALLHCYCQQHQLSELPLNDRRGYFILLRKALMAWHNNELEGLLPESWHDFEHRVQDALAFATEQSQTGQKQRVLIISSGGPIAMAMKLVLKLAVNTMVDLNLQIMNTSTSRLLKTRNGLQLINFNSIAHLDDPIRADSITYS